MSAIIVWLQTIKQQILLEFADLHFVDQRRTFLWSLVRLTSAPFKVEYCTPTDLWYRKPVGNIAIVVGLHDLSVQSVRL